MSENRRDRVRRQARKRFAWRAAGKKKLIMKKIGRENAVPEGAFIRLLKFAY